MDNDISPILHRAVAILDCFNQDRPEIGVREAARLGDLSSSALAADGIDAESGILSQNPESKAYCLGPRVSNLGGVFIQPRWT